VGNFFQAIQRGFKAAAGELGPGRFEVEGKPLRCPHCGDDTFAEGEVLLSTVGMTFVGD
jgi:hypothetical protein